jgi:AcrR family transcriptional regulator
MSGTNFPSDKAGTAGETGPAAAQPSESLGCHACASNPYFLYFHFKSKEELAKAVIHAQHKMSVDQSTAILQEKHSALTAMRLLCRSFGQQLLDESVVRAGIRLTFEASSFGHAVQQPYLDWISTMESLVRAAQREGSVRSSVEPAALARYIVASFTGVQMLAEVRTERRDLMEEIEQMWGFLLTGITD